VPPHTRVEPLEFEDVKFRVENFQGAACHRCGSAATYLDEIIDDVSGRRIFLCSDTGNCDLRVGQRQESKCGSATPES